MTTRKNSTTVVTPAKLSNSRPSRPSTARMAQNFRLVWLDESIDEENNDDCRNSIIQLQQVINAIDTFIDVDRCIDFITDINQEKTFLMVSEASSQTIVSIAQDIPQVSCIYIFCGNEARCETQPKQWSKIQGVYTDIIPICEALRQAAQDCDHNSVSISFVKPTDETLKENLDILDPSFMYTQILKEILLTIDFEQEHINEFLIYCREQFVGNSGELKNVDKIEREYHHHEPIWWYTYSCFLYSMLNRTLRMMEVDLIIKMGFFVRDLHKHIVALHAKQYVRPNHSNPFIVYRGQGLSPVDFNQLMKTKGGLMSFNNFLSTSLDRAVSLAFAESNQFHPDFIGVLFEITIDPSIPTSPFANVENVGYFKGEEEILFSMHSVFHIGQVQQIDKNDCLWQVDLTLTGDNDRQLHVLTERMREETRGPTGWFRLGQLMIRLGQFNKAEDLYEILLKQSTNDGEKAHLFSQLGWAKTGQGNYPEAIESYEKALEIEQTILPANHPFLATSCNNIGAVYHKIGEYSKALSSYEKALEIWQKTLPANHPDLSGSYNNMDVTYQNMGEYSKALSSYEKALEILQKNLPPNHPRLANCYSNIGLVYKKMGEYSKALSYYEKALEIQQKTLPANHPDLATSYNNIGEMYTDMGECSRALSSYEKALEIQQKTLPAHHPDLATSYNNMGGVYINMGEHSKALSYFEQALEIRQKTLPKNHPMLATSYNNIGEMYRNMGEYSKVLSYHEKALEIFQKTLSADHPSLATSYSNIGLVYYHMSDYSKALSYYQHALDIRLRSLPPNHPDLRAVRQDIEIVKKKV